MSKLLYKTESYKIIGCCFEVFNYLGSGFLEAVYQEALSMEFRNQGIPFLEFPEMKVYYKNMELKKKYYPDYLCYDNIILEIKALEGLLPEHYSQVLNYVKGTESSLGLLVNFGSVSIQHKRFANTKN